MISAEVCYYPNRGFGHIGIFIKFSEAEVPEPAEEYWLPVIDSRYEVSGKAVEPGDLPVYLKQEMLSARRSCTPLLIKDKDDNSYSIYGYKEGTWQTTRLDFDNLSTEEQTVLTATGMQSLMRVNSKKDSLLSKLITSAHLRKRTEYFFDWGGHFDYYEAPGVVRIALPPINKSYQDFMACFEEKPKEVKVFLSTDPGAQFDGGNEEYSYFTNNCAHSVSYLLYAAGYSEQPNTRIGLTPIEVALQACNMADGRRSQFRKKLLTKLDPHTEKTVKQLIDLSIHRLNDNFEFGFGKPLGLLNELISLEKIQYDGTEDAIERLLEVSEQVGPKTAQELQECIRLVPPKECFLASIKRLEVAASNYSNIQDRDCLKAVAEELRQKHANFEQRSLTPDDFRKKCAESLAKAQPILEKKGSKGVQILKNIALAIVGLVALYFIAACINKSTTGSYLFFKTGPYPERVSQHIEEQLNKIAPHGTI